MTEWEATILAQQKWREMALWEQWVVATMVAEVLGIGAIALAATFLPTVEASRLREALVASIGAVYGAILGVAQWLVLRRRIPHSEGWILATVGGSLVAWVVGVLVSVLLALTYFGETDYRGSVLPAIALLGAWIGLVLGFAQWTVLRRVYQRATLWVGANVIAWAVGLPIAFIGAGLTQQATSTLKSTLIGVLTGVASGTMIGVITGTALVWLLRSRSPRP